MKNPIDRQQEQKKRFDVLTFVMGRLIPAVTIGICVAVFVGALTAAYLSMAGYDPKRECTLPIVNELVVQGVDLDDALWLARQDCR